MLKSVSGVFMYKHVKRVIDFTGALFLAAALVLPIVVIALIIQAEDSGPVLFRQERPGKDGKLFTIYKFRTMSNDTHKGGKWLSDIERTTRLGSILRKMSLDELPQIYNVLRGDMSFIGPRPLLKEYLPLYSTRQSHRHDVLPGITGFAQVNGRNAITWEQKFEYDVIYVENLKFRMDTKIFLKTIWNVIRRDNVNNSADTTMEHFKGNSVAGTIVTDMSTSL